MKWADSSTPGRGITTYYGAIEYWLLVVEYVGTVRHVVEVKGQVKNLTSSSGLARSQAMYLGRLVPEIFPSGDETTGNEKHMLHHTH